MFSAKSFLEYSWVMLHAQYFYQILTDALEIV